MFRTAIEVQLEEDVLQAVCLEMPKPNTEMEFGKSQYD